MHLESTDLGLLVGAKGKWGLSEAANEKEIEFIYLNKTTCVMNIMNHPVEIQMSKALSNKVKEKQIEIENDQTIHDKNQIFQSTANALLTLPKKNAPYIITEKLKSNILDLLKTSLIFYQATSPLGGANKYWENKCGHVPGRVTWTESLSSEQS